MNKRLFCCYSVHLRDYLKSLGFRYELCALNPNSKAMFWAYMRTNELNNALNNWVGETLR